MSDQASVKRGAAPTPEANDAPKRARNDSAGQQARNNVVTVRTGNAPLSYSAVLKDMNAATRAEVALIQADVPMEIKTGILDEMAALRNTICKKYEAVREARFELAHQIDRCARFDTSDRLTLDMQINELLAIKTATSIALKSAQEERSVGQMDPEHGEETAGEAL